MLVQGHAMAGGATQSETTDRIYRSELGRKMLVGGLSVESNVSVINNIINLIITIKVWSD